MRRRFAQTIDEMRGLINEWSAPVLLAVSGGVDSMCMAELFLSARQSVDFAVAHCNFCLRGDESDGDEALVRGWADANGIRFHSVSFDTEAYSREHGVSIEMAARELRYGWFAQLCREHGYRAVAVAHNANDNAETMILNLVRGTGLKGMGGMAAVSVLPCSGADGSLAELKLIRPMLSFTRKQIEGFAFSEKIPYREDSTNSSVVYKRNSIRHEVIPVLAKLNPSFIRTLNREAGYFSEAEEIVSDYCSAVIPDLVTTGRNGDTAVEIGIDSLMAHRHWRYLLFRILEPYGFSSAVLGSIEDLLSSGRTVSGKRFESADYVLFTERGRLAVKEKQESLLNQTGHDVCVKVEGDGVYEACGRRFKVESLEWDSSMPLKQPSGTVIMDASKISFPFVCRPWRQGDWMMPFGMRGKKKVSDVFGDLKYGIMEKQQAVMVVKSPEDSHIAAIAGVRIDQGVKVDKDTESIIRITNI